MCVLLPRGPPFVLDLLLAVGQISSVLPRAGWQPLLLQPRAAGAAFLPLARVTCAALRGRRSSGSLCAPGQEGGAGLSLPGSRGAGQPHSRAGQQQVLSGSSAASFSWCPELSLPHVFGSPRQSLGRSVVGRGILHVPVSEPSSSGPWPSPRCSVLVFGCGAVPRVPFGDPWMGSRAWQPRAKIGGAAAAWARPSLPAGPEAPPEQSPRLSSVYLRVFHGTPPAALPRGCSVGTGFALDPLPGCVRGEAEQKLRVRCPEREDRRGQERTGEKALGAPREVSEADRFPKRCLAGVYRVSPSPAVPAGSEGCPRGDSLSRRSLSPLPACLRVAREGSCSLLRWQPPSSKD